MWRNLMLALAVGALLGAGAAGGLDDPADTGRDALLEPETAGSNIWVGGRCGHCPQGTRCIRDFRGVWSCVPK